MDQKAEADWVKSTLARFDGKHVAPLKTLVAASSGVLLAELPGSHEVGASWVLKAKAEAGEIDVRVFGKLAALSESDAILHVLQMVQLAPEAGLPDLEPFLNHKKLLVRVWALDALFRTDPARAAPLIEEALKNPSAAMRARARALRNA